MSTDPIDDFFHDPGLDPTVLERALERPAAGRRLVRQAQHEWALHRLHRRHGLAAAVAGPGHPSFFSLMKAAAILLVGIGIGLLGARFIAGQMEPQGIAAACVLQGPVLVDGHSDRPIVPGVELRTPADSGGLVRLADGSQLALEADSRYRVAETEAADLRQRGILKRGAARFIVTPDPRRFIVEAGKARIAVLGTSFHVQHRHADLADDTAVAVAVQEGRVQVDLGKRSVLLQAGDRQVFLSEEPKPRRRRGRLLELVSDEQLSVSSVRGQSQRFAIAAPLDISFEGDPVASAIPPPGALVEVAIDRQSRATALRVLRPVLKGTILAYDGDSRALTVIPVDSDSPIQTWPLTPTAEVTQRRGTDLDLRPGRVVQIRLTTDWSAIEAVQLRD